MKKFGDIFSSKRRKKRLSVSKISKALVIQKEHIEALENEEWNKLPEAPYVKGYIKSYAQYLGIDVEYALALYRREFDESKQPKRPSFTHEKRLFITPKKLLNITFALSVLVFITYIIVQYSSIFSSPKLEIINPKSDITTSVPAIKIEGQTEKGASISVNGTFVAVDEDGLFSHEYILEGGRNNIEIISAFRLSPKNKITRIVRLIE